MTTTLRIETNPTNEMTLQAGWIAYATTQNDRSAMAARLGVLHGEPVEGPAEEPASFSARSTARMFGRL